MLTIKGSKGGIVITLPEKVTLSEAKKELKERFFATKEFFNKGRINVAIDAENFSEFEKCELQSVIKEILDEAIISFVPIEELKIAENSPEEVDEPTRFFKGTVRSGQRIEAAGNLVVIGDANPGSELVAGGNVIVVGSLKGVVQAGAGGNKNAFVLALDMMPTQLRIANLITRAPDNLSENVDIFPEIATIKEDGIIIERFSSKS